MAVAAKGIAAEQDLVLARSELRLERRMLLVQGVMFLLLFFVTFTGRYISFRFIGLFNGLYFLANALFVIWCEAVPELHRIKQRGQYRVYVHTVGSIFACAIYMMVEDEHNEALVRGGALFIWPLSVAWESREASKMDLCAGFLVVHVAMTIARFHTTFLSTGWQMVLVVFSADTVIFNLAKGRSTVHADKDRITGLCTTIKRLLRTMCDGYCLLDSEGRIVGADLKLSSFLGLGADMSALIGMKLEDLAMGDSKSADRITSEGLQRQVFHSAGENLEADVYTVPCNLSPASVPDILGHAGAAVTEDLDGFLCAVRHMSISEQLEKRPSNLSLAMAETDFGVEAEELSLLHTANTNEAASSSHSPTHMSPTVRNSEDLLDSDVFESASEAGQLSEAPSFQNVGAPGGFFPPTKTIGIGVGEYKKVEMISRGAQGVVWKVTDCGARPFAMKELRLPGILWRRDFTANLVRADREVRCLKRLQWASGVVVQTMDSWLQEDMTLCIVMEWLPSSLRHVLSGRQKNNQGPPPLEDTCRWLTHVAVGLAVVHAEGIMHRDIKPSNLLLTPDMHGCKVADLGLSREVKQQPIVGQALENSSSVCGASETMSLCSAYTAKCGTRGFQSPEILTGGSYDYSTDVYSLGCVLLELLTLTKPSALPMTPEMATDLFPRQSSVEQHELQQLCLEMLKESPTERPTAPAVAKAEALKSPLSALLHNHRELGGVLGEAVEAEDLSECSKDALGVVALDARGVVRKWGAGVADLLGISETLAVGRQMMEAFIPNADRAEFSRLVGPVVRGLSREAHGQLRLQSTSRTLRLSATVRPAGLPPHSRRPLGRRSACPGIILELWPLRAAGSEEPPQRSPTAAEKHLADSPSTSFKVQSEPAHLVTQRAPCPDSFVEREGLYERHTRAWSSVAE